MPMTSVLERDRRWKAAREMMARRDVDVIIGNGDLGDQWASLRYFSGYRSMYDDAAIMVFKEGESELIVTHPGVGGFAAWTSWVPTPRMVEAPASLLPNRQSDLPLRDGPTVAGAISNILNDRGVTRVGIADFEHFSAGWVETIKASVPNVVFVDLCQEVRALRLVKSSIEIDLMREAARISDLVWDEMADIVQVGRKRYEVLADWEAIIRMHGCEDSFNMILPLPHLKDPLDTCPISALEIKQGDVLIAEVTPRYQGYYAQQTGMVTLGPVPRDIAKVYDSVNRARDAGLNIIKPGVDILEVSAACGASIQSDGYEMPSSVIGHFCGLDLEEPPLAIGSVVLEEGMTFIFHPFVAGYPAVMRGDTYVVTGSGVECLTSGNTSPLHLAV